MSICLHTETASLSEEPIDIQEVIIKTKGKISMYGWSGGCLAEKGLITTYFDSEYFQESLGRTVKMLINSHEFPTYLINSAFLSDLLVAYIYNRGSAEYNNVPGGFSATPPPEWENSHRWQALLALTAKNQKSNVIPFSHMLGINNQLMFNTLLKNGEESTNLSVSEPIILASATKPLSIRQTLGLALISR